MDETVTPVTAPLPVTDFEPQSPTVRWRELVAVAALVILGDLTIYRSGGFTGFALGLGLAPLCLA